MKLEKDKSNQQSGDIKRHQIVAKLGDPERELIRLGLPVPNREEDIPKLSALVAKYLPYWPDRTKTPCCILFQQTQKHHSRRCQRSSSPAQSDDDDHVDAREYDPGERVRTAGGQISALGYFASQVQAQTSKDLAGQNGITQERTLQDFSLPELSKAPGAEALPNSSATKGSSISHCVTPSILPIRKNSKPCLHGNLPSRPQELPFAHYLLDLEIPVEHAIDVWFTQILGTPDIDAIIVCRGVGLFVIELKSWGLTCFKQITAVQGVEIQESVKKSTKKTPWQQAFEAGDAFSTKLSANFPANSNPRSAWVSCGACLFNIPRSRFLRYADDPRNSRYAVETISKGVLFSEDLKDGAAFVRQLQYIKANPLYRKKPNKSYDKPSVYSDALVNELEPFINFKITLCAKPTPSDLDRLKRIENEEEHDLDRRDLSNDIICTGFAGTGKTVLALQAAVRQKIPTLFTCYNKVLATDVRRLTGFSDKYNEFSFEVYDIFDLIEVCESRLELPPLQVNRTEGQQRIDPDKAFDFKAAKRVDRIIVTDQQSGRSLAGSWKFIIVDEAQDLKEYSWSLLDWLSRDHSSLFVIDGKNQQLYRQGRSAFVDTALAARVPTGNRITKRRVFRTTRETFLLGQLWAENFPIVSRATRAWESKYRKQYLRALEEVASQAEFDFDLAREGAAPALHNLAGNGMGERFNLEMAVNFTADLIKVALDRLAVFEGLPSDILLLVPFASTVASRIDWKSVAAAACKSLNLDYLDYTANQYRRLAYTPDEVRIATFHSSRGIEALHSIVLGMECLSTAAKEQNDVAANLGYIALTRSLFETDLVYYRPVNSISTDIGFLEGIVKATGF